MINRLLRSRPAATVVLLSGFAVAVGLRVGVSSHDGPQSLLGGLVFALCLVTLGLATKTKMTVTRRSVLVGSIGGLALCLPALVARFVHPEAAIPAQGFAWWALIVTIVAVTEEYFLRGALYEAAYTWLGEIAAVLIGAIAFAALHIPLYGWHVAPLDFAVGLSLGAIRVIGRSTSAPAIAHTLADLCGWWLR